MSPWPTARSLLGLGPAKSRLLSQLIDWLRPHRAIVLRALALSVTLAVVDLAGPYFIRHAIDVDLASGNLRRLAWTSIWYLAAVLLSAVVRHLYVVNVELMAQRVTGVIRRAVHDHIQVVPIAELERRPAGELIARVTSDVDALRGLFTSSLMGTLADLASLLAIVGMLIALDVELALITFALAPAALFAARYLRRQVRREHHRSGGHNARLKTFVQEHLVGMLAVQLFQRERRAGVELGELSARHIENRTRLGRWRGRLSPVLDLLIASTIALLLGFGGREVLAGTLSVGSLVAAIQYAERFWRLLSQFCDQASTIQGPISAAERIVSLLDTPAAAAARAPVSRVPGMAAIAFEHVWFTYGGSPAAADGADERARVQWALRDVTFGVEEGCFAALVGMTGAGKSSIISLLTGFYAAQRGRVLVDGIDVRDYDVRSLRSGLVLVPQDVRLFSGTIADNIRLGTPLTDDEVRAAARAARAHRFIEALPSGYATPVMERGINLSAGQQQLIVLARALARQPRTLILDEPASVVDDESSGAMADALAAQRGRRTVILVAHRLSTVEHADQILVMHQGRLRERGTHRQLLMRKGIYARLAELQCDLDSRQTETLR